jgi:hypothetical protein
MFAVVGTGLEAVQGDGLIAVDSGSPIGRGRVHASDIDVAFGAGHEDRPRLVNLEESAEVQRVDVVRFAIADLNERRDCAAQIEQRMQF